MIAKMLEQLFASILIWRWLIIVRKVKKSFLEMGG